MNDDCLNCWGYIMSNFDELGFEPAFFPANAQSSIASCLRFIYGWRYWGTTVLEAMAVAAEPTFEEFWEQLGTMVALLFQINAEEWPIKLKIICSVGQQESTKENV